MKVQRYDYPSQFSKDAEVLFSSLRNLVEYGPYIQGTMLADFEKNFAAYIGVEHATGVNSGTDALIMAIMALDLDAGEEVIVPANTFYATVAAIRLAGAKPVLVDADEDSFLIDVSMIESAITQRTRVLLPVHLYGKPAPMDSVQEIAARHGLKVVEDAAQAHGARYRGKMVGSIGDIGCFSFHPSKNLAAAGDAGAVVSNDAALDTRLRTLRTLGQDGQNNHVMIGLNSKLDELQALVLDHKLLMLDQWNEDRRRIATLLFEELKDLPVQFQSTDSEEEHVYHLFQLRTNERDRLLDHLNLKGVEATIRYPVPIHLQPAFADQNWAVGQFPVAEALAGELLTLPIRPSMPDREIEYMITAVRQFFRSVS
jgi:dTDP-4-amino-4,6-dideoxygalactose transaminase